MKNFRKSMPFLGTKKAAKNISEPGKSNLHNLPQEILYEILDRTLDHIVAQKDNQLSEVIQKNLIKAITRFRGIHPNTRNAVDQRPSVYPKASTQKEGAKILRSMIYENRVYAPIYAKNDPRPRSAIQHFLKDPIIDDYLKSNYEGGILNPYQRRNILAKYGDDEQRDYAVKRAKTMPPNMTIDILASAVNGSYDNQSAVKPIKLLGWKDRLQTRLDLKMLDMSKKSSSQKRIKTGQIERKYADRAHKRVTKHFGR